MTFHDDLEAILHILLTVSNY